jgi:hypothetical protein
MIKIKPSAASGFDAHFFHFPQLISLISIIGRGALACSHGDSLPRVASPSLLKWETESIGLARGGLQFDAHFPLSSN